jgi:uncharacterized protein YdaU (DUF1376 family)
MADSPEPKNKRTNFFSAPYFPFYVKDWLVITRDLTASQRGAYIELCAEAWLSDPPCVLPDNDTKLAKLASLTPMAWQRMRDVVRGFFEIVPHGLREPRLFHHYTTMVNNSQKRAAAGRKGATARWQSTDAFATDLPSHPDSKQESKTQTHPDQTQARNGSRIGEDLSVLASTSDTDNLDPVRHAWKAGSGGALPEEKLKRTCAPLEAEHGASEVARRLTIYCAATEGRFLSIDHFAQTFGKWESDNRRDARGIPLSLRADGQPTTVHIRR